MRALLVLMVTAMAGCATTAPTTGADSAASEAAASESTPADSIDLTRGQWVETHGLSLRLRGTRTEHHSSSARLVRAELEVRKGDEDLTISLEREQPGDAEFVAVFDTAIALESVDNSEKPSKARILVQP